MSERRWGLLGDPFAEESLVPRPFLASDSFRRAYRDLLAAARAGRSFALLSGEPGTGKTTLLNYLIRGLPFANLDVVSYCPESTPSAPHNSDSVRENPSVASPSNLASARTDWRQIRDRIVELVGRERGVVLAVDDADALPDDILTDVLILRGELASAAGTLTVLMAASPTFSRRLPAHDGRAESAPGHVELRPLSDAEVGAYVAEALARVGRRDRGLFAGEAIEVLARRSSGLPGMLNAICRAALSLAAARGLDIVTPELIDEAADACAPSAASPAPTKGSSAASPIAGQHPAAPTGMDQHSHVTAPSVPPVKHRETDRLFERTDSLPLLWNERASSAPCPAAPAWSSDAKRHRDRPLPFMVVAYAAGAGLIMIGTLAWQVLRSDGETTAGVDGLRRWVASAPAIPGDGSGPSQSASQQASPPPAPGDPNLDSQQAYRTTAPEPIPETNTAPLPPASEPSGSSPLPETPAGAAAGRPAPSPSREALRKTDSATEARGRAAAPAFEASGPPGAPTARDVARQPAAAAEVASLIERGDELLRQSGAVSARLLYEHAAHKGSAQAMTAMAASYDPLALLELPAKGLAPDPSMAISWYQRAIKAGDIDARSRLSRLVDALRREGTMTAADASALLLGGD